MPVALTVSREKEPVCSFSGAHSSFVRPNPATRSVCPALGAVVASASGVTPSTGAARRASTRSRS